MLWRYYLSRQPLALIILVALISGAFLATTIVVNAQGQVYYVATNGNDANPGTLAQPFATWQKAIDRAQPGDTIYLRGGVYAVSGNRERGVSIVGRNGTAANPIKLWAYQDETPILDAAGLTSTGELRGLYISASWWHLKGFEIRNVPMRSGAAFVYGLLCESCNNNKFERLNIHHNQGTGLAIAYNASNNLVENSDFHHNYDSNRTDGPGNHANGMFIYTPGYATSGNVVRGCRAWWNSDDGFDLWEAEGVVLFENNWAFWQGYLPDTFTPVPAGNGNGFKLGINTTGKRHLIHHNLAFENHAKGFDANEASGIQDWYNNTAYNNGYGNFQNLRLPDGTVVNHRLRNNLAFDSVTLSPKNNLDGADQEANAWNLAVTVNAADFVSLNSAGVDGPRQVDGSLPNLNFLRLAPGSDLLDCGANVGLPFTGTAPDLGAFESGATAPTVTPTLTPTPTNTPVNLIRNGDFSAGNDPWWWALQGNDGLTYGTAGVTNQELCTTINRSAPTFLIRLGQGAIPMQDGVTYRIEFDARANRATTLLLQLYRYDPVGDSYSEPQFALNTTTQHFVHDYLGHSGLAALEFQPQMQVGATICLDNVSWRPLPAPSATPVAPSALTAVTVSTQQITLAWRDNANNETGFQLERCLGNNCTNFSELVRLNANVRSYSSTGLTADTTYCYRVRAFNAVGSSAYSNSACRTTGPRPPTSLTANRILATEANLFWVETTSNETGFKLQRCTGATCTNFAQVALLPANGIGYHDTGLTANTTYRYRVAAYTADGNSAYSAIRTITTAAATVASAEESNPATETIPAETAIFAVQPQSQLALTTQVACFNQRQPTAVHLWAGEQSVPMTTTSPQGDLYQATLLVNDQFSDTLDYPLSVHWQCAGIEEPLVEYLGIMQVRVASEEPEGATRNFLPIVVQADK
ncbi:MAG: right-handed parallel beta-helix repeat-containing protein [Caldilineaceae bacterium]